MKIAFVAPPVADKQDITPPVALGYIAAVQEQQRHIVRIYDLALGDDTLTQNALAQLRIFRPHLTLVATEESKVSNALKQALLETDNHVIWLGVELRHVLPDHTMMQAIWYLNHRSDTDNKQKIIVDSLVQLIDSIDALPFPARHLLPLEQYSLHTPSGDLQTTLVIGQRKTVDEIVFRQPSLIVAEMQSIVREYGIHHFAFSKEPITHNAVWLDDLLQQLTKSKLGIGWEACISYKAPNTTQLRAMKAAGCEVLCCTFTAGDVLPSQCERDALLLFVKEAHACGIDVRARITLDAPYAAIPALVDLSATFGLDTVHFTVSQEHTTNGQPTTEEKLSVEAVAEMARLRYQSSRNRQFFIDRFGPQFGPMIWRFGRAGLLGRTWHRYATGSEDGAFVF
ncbi:MAG: hypothetical protein GFH27_549285n50 [Chloroflexi bacterium AL-W]|nr:hypothetical protein [Chloroflexi bacterium AL-N1]NOK65562.1 hypothetical protein [Chloroflexi bacterium AL-N10]NOK74497.1 hypothetical protein [Chloroflexi bacterium AL-N5]NOK80595.1 hypothetical protein [Chloroflexi bacterium AL-W]NOK88755.1 hypothetical protein [Chloroflexi bacterium AL-N15]